MHLRGARAKKYCNLQIKMKIFNKTFKNEAQKKHQKITQKSTKKRPLTPQNGAPVETKR